MSKAGSVGGPFGCQVPLRDAVVSVECAHAGQVDEREVAVGGGDGVAEVMAEHVTLATEPGWVEIARDDLVKTDQRHLDVFSEEKDEDRVSAHSYHTLAGGLHHR